MFSERKTKGAAGILTALGVAGIVAAYIYCKTEKQVEEQKTDVTESKPPICCFFLTRGVCNPPRPPCPFWHGKDDGRACSFGGKCRQGHKKRAPPINWDEYNSNGGKVGLSPAVRDPSLLRSQLEPLRTGELRVRLVTCFGMQYDQVDPLKRRELMPLLLKAYENLGPRHIVRREGVHVRKDLRDVILEQMKKWAAKQGEVNHRVSISAKTYTILRSKGTFGSATSRKALRAAKKVEANQVLWDLALEALSEADSDFEVSAIALTKGFKGSPHIDKQNTGPFYGMSLGSFPDGEGGIRVEGRFDTVVEVNTKNRLAKVDGRYVHWVAPYDSQHERYSLIFYSTTSKYTKPQTAVWPELTDAEIHMSSETC